MTSRPPAPEVVLHEERLRLSTRSEPVERVVLRRRITSRVRQVEVTVRREELEIEYVPVSGTGRASAPPAPPLTILLSEEVPVVTLRTRPYEQVTVTVVDVRDAQRHTEALSRESVEVTSDPPLPPPFHP